MDTLVKDHVNAISRRCLRGIGQEVERLLPRIKTDMKAFAVSQEGAPESVAIFRQSMGKFTDDIVTLCIQHLLTSLAGGQAMLECVNHTLRDLGLEHETFEHRIDDLLADNRILKHDLEQREAAVQTLQGKLNTADTNRCTKGGTELDAIEGGKLKRKASPKPKPKADADGDGPSVKDDAPISNRFCRKTMRDFRKKVSSPILDAPLFKDQQDPFSTQSFLAHRGSPYTFFPYIAHEEFSTHTMPQLKRAVLQNIWSHLARPQKGGAPASKAVKFAADILEFVSDGVARVMKDQLHERKVDDVNDFKVAIVKVLRDCDSKFRHPKLKLDSPRGKRGIHGQQDESDDVLTLLNVAAEFVTFWDAKKEECSELRTSTPQQPNCGGTEQSSIAESEKITPTRRDIGGPLLDRQHAPAKRPRTDSVWPENKSEDMPTFAFPEPRELERSDSEIVRNLEAQFHGDHSDGPNSGEDRSGVSGPESSVSTRSDEGSMQSDG